MTDRATEPPEGVSPAFDAMRNATYCPFAKRARVRFTPPWSDALGFDRNVAVHAAALTGFVDEGERNAVHGFVSEIRLGEDARVFESVRRAFRGYLDGLARHDEDCRRSLQGDKLSRDWQFSFGGLRMFLNVFAPCYPRSHSKFVDSPCSFWIFFQPEYSFDLCGIDPTKIGTKDTIRAAFREAGMAYDGAQIDRRIEALLYMFPASLTEGPVRWWE